MAYARPKDIPAHPEPQVAARSLQVHVHPSRIEPGALAGGVVIVIDALRASVTITQALASGATSVIPVMNVEDAFAVRERRWSEGVAHDRVLLGGERGGVTIEGFDLDNSPASYPRERVEGRVVIFTTTNGTSALLHAKQAIRVLVGSFANLSGVCKAVANEERPVHILCAGTRDEISMDDCLPAGGMVEVLERRGRALLSDDSARLCRLAWEGAKAQAGGVLRAMQESRGGRNLLRIGLGSDVEFCSRIDTISVVPEFDVARGEITLSSPREE